MSEPLPFLRLVGDFWVTLGVKTLIRAQDALNDVENDAYTFEKCARDTLGFYNDSIGTWITLTANPTTSIPPPTLAIPVALLTDKATGKLVLGLAAGTVLTASALFKSGSVSVPKGNVTPTVTVAGDLQVDVSGLNAVPVVVGIYEGLVVAGPKLIAKVQLQVT